MGKLRSEGLCVPGPLKLLWTPRPAQASKMPTTENEKVSGEEMDNIVRREEGIVMVLTTMVQLEITYRVHPRAGALIAPKQYFSSQLIDLMTILKYLILNSKRKLMLSGSMELHTIISVFLLTHI